MNAPSSSKNATNNIYNLDRGSGTRSKNFNEWNLDYSITAVDSVINVVHDVSPNFHQLAKKSRPVASPPTLANLTEEFNDLTRKMTLLREALKRPKTGSERESGPIVVNASVQALQVGNVSDVLAAKQFIHDCIVELTLIDHFLDGNEEMTAHYRGKLENVIGRESAKAKTIVIQGASIAPSGLETISHGQTIVSDSAIGTSDDLVRLHTKEVEAQTEVIKTKDNDASGSQIHNGVPHDANEFSKDVNETLKQSKKKTKKKSKKWQAKMTQLIRMINENLNEFNK